MDVKEICLDFPEKSPTIGEAKYVVQNYIYERKNQDVIIDLHKRSSIEDFMNFDFEKEQEYLLGEAFKIACDWFKKEKFKINN